MASAYTLLPESQKSSMVLSVRLRFLTDWCLVSIYRHSIFESVLEAVFIVVKEVQFLGMRNELTGGVA